MRTNNLDISNETGSVGTRTFTFPHEVIDDPTLSFSQKCAILSEWASDASAVESFPTLRLLPGTSFPVSYSSIMDAREQLERRKRKRAVAKNDTAMSDSGRIIWADFRRQKDLGRVQHFDD